MQLAIMPFQMRNGLDPVALRPYFSISLPKINLVCTRMVLLQQLLKAPLALSTFIVYHHFPDLSIAFGDFYITLNFLHFLLCTLYKTFNFVLLYGGFLHDQHGISTTVFLDDFRIFPGVFEYGFRKTSVYKSAQF